MTCWTESKWAVSGWLYDVADEITSLAQRVEDCETEEQLTQTLGYVDMCLAVMANDLLGEDEE